jgi:hypothetical protein
VINWLKAKVNPVPTQYDCLLLLANGDVHLGRPQAEMVIIGWSIVNRPDWINPKVKCGHVSGEDHPKSRLSDADCELIRILCDPDDSNRLSYADAANKYECSKSTIRDIVKYRRRAS